MHLFSKMAFILLTAMPTIKNYQYLRPAKLKAQPRVICHQEYDYINETPVSVCGAWTEYPTTNYEISHSSKLYREWLSNVTYSSKVRRDTDEGVTDYYFPTKIDGKSARGDVKYLTDFTNAVTITATYKTVKTTRKFGNISVSLGSFGKTVQKGLQKNSFTLPSIGFSAGIDNYTETTREISLTYNNPSTSGEYQFNVAKYDVYIPIKVLTYHYYGPASYIYKEDFIFYKIYTADFIVASNNYYRDPFGKRGNLTYTGSVADSLKNDVLPMYFNLFDYYSK